MASRDKQPSVGIDLGTTYSAVAYIDEHGRPTTLVNAEGDLVTPSAVLFDEGGVVVGKEAVKALATEAESVAQCAKRDLGYRAFHKNLDGRTYPPEAIQALILAKLRRDAGDLIGDFREVVVTVPAYFDEVRRKATQDAGFMAGLKVLDIINEPTAAAIAYGYNQGILDADGAVRGSEKILVYDLGGGTFDVTVMEIEARNFTTLATDGDVLLGGHDWDQRLVSYVANQFIDTHKVDPRQDPSTAGRLWREAEDAKRTLSARNKATIPIDYQGHAMRVEITRELFQELTHDLLNRTEFTTRHTLQAAGLQWSDIDRVLMVGGSTRMPMVAELLRQLSGKEPDRSVSVDEAVAHGAALRAGMLQKASSDDVTALQIKNVNSHSLGVVGLDPATHEPRNAIVIPRNTSLPVSARRIFKTKRAGQRSILVQIVEGENQSPADCSQIGQCVVRDLPKDLPAETSIDVRFHYLENGRLTILVKVEGTDTRLKHHIERANSLSAEELKTWQQYVAALSNGDVAEFPVSAAENSAKATGQA